MSTPSRPAPLAAELARARTAAQRYHDLVASRYDAGMREHFDAVSREELLDYGGRLLCPFIRPHFLTLGQLQWVQRELDAVLEALHELGQLAITSAEVRQAVALTAEEAELFALEPGYDMPSAMSRIDTFLTDDGLHLVEYNAECPTGVGYNQRLFRLFGRFPIMQQFLDGQPLLATDGVEHVLQALLSSYRQWGGRKAPQIAIVDWPHVVTRTEFEIFRTHFEARGYPTRIVDPRELELSQGVLTHDGFRIDIVYRRLLTTEFVQRRSDCRTFEQAYRTRAACFVNSFRTKALHKKLVFAALRDERFLSRLPVAVREVVLRAVPWTVRVQDGKVQWNGQPRDLTAVATEQQSQLVLKPNDEYGGRGIVLGWTVSAADWQAALQRALQEGADAASVWVLQAAVPTHQEAFPDLDGHVAPRFVDLDPFVFGRQWYGFLTRLSNSAISNVTTGGGQAPTFVLP